MNLGSIDVTIIALYFILIFAAGVYMERRAGKSMEAYFLANRSMPWWVLGMSGSSTYFDITGTMWMVSVFYVLGMRGMWLHAFWCFPFAGFVMAYKAKWAYRSGVLTGLEWLIFRYGAGRAGQAARTVTLVIALIGMSLMLGYAGTGVGKFLEEFLPYPKSVMIPILFTFTGIYVILGGFFGVVCTDFIQTIVLSFAALYISIIAFLQIDPVAFRETVGADWFSLKPVMNLPQPTEEYPDIFGLLVMLWVIKGVMGLIGFGGGGADFQRFRAARTEGEACKIGFAWGMVITVRWSMVMGFTAFGLFILSAQGDAIDSESVLPMMINQVLPVGIKGLVAAGLLAAFMSTFDSTLNVAASFIVNDFVKPLWKTASTRQLMRVSYASTLAVLIVGVFISLRTERITDIWTPINFALGAALLGPGLMAGYWWRLSGWSICASACCTLPAAFYVNRFTEMRELQYFPLLAGISLTASIAAAYLFPSTPEEALKNYYRKVRPFGFWGPVRRMLAEDGEDSSRFQRDRWDIPVAIAGTLFFIVLYLLAMDLVLHNWGRAFCFALATVALAVPLYLTWWRRLDS
jgi:solute:Na+ symporter, SSS family